MTCSSSTTCTPEAPVSTAGLKAVLLAMLVALAIPADAGGKAGSQGLARLRARAAQELAQGNMAKAGDALNRALAVGPLDSGLWVDIARFRYRGGEHLLAFAAAQRALDLGPQDPAALGLKAELVRDSEGKVPALAWFEKAIERAPDDLSLKLEYAATLGEAGRANDMLVTTREVLERDPKNARAFYLQAVLAARAGNYALAKRLLARTQGRLDKLPGTLLLRAIVEMDAQNHQLAIESLETLVERQPGNRRARDLLARALFLSGEHAEVTGRFSAAAQRADASAYLVMTVARAWEQLDRRDRAAPLLDRVAGAAPLPVVPVAGHEPVGRMLEAGETGSARALVGGWLAANPGNYDHLALAGDVELLAGNPGGAIRFYERAARIRNPDSLVLRRVQALLSVRDPGSAIALAEARLAASPGKTSLRRAVALMASGAGDWPRARRLLETVAGAGESRDVQLLSDLALVQVRTGDAALGAETAHKAQAIYRAHPISTQALGIALVAGGEQPRNAAALLAKARAMLGDNPLLVEARMVLAAQRPPG